MYLYPTLYCNKKPLLEIIDISNLPQMPNWFLNLELVAVGEFEFVKVFNISAGKKLHEFAKGSVKNWQSG